MENKSDGVVPTGTRVINNLVVSKSFLNSSLRLQFSAEAIDFAGNIVYHASGNYGTTGLAGVTYGVDPLLLDDATRGYKIPNTGSIAIDRGVDIDPPTQADLAGQPRTVGSVDVGAIEHRGEWLGSQSTAQ